MSSQNPLIVESVQSIIKTMISIPQMTRPSSRKGGFASSLHVPAGVSQASILNELGFAGLLEAASFQNVTKQRKIRNATLACHVVESIL